MSSDNIVVNADSPRGSGPGRSARLVAAAVLAVCVVVLLLLAFVWTSTKEGDRRVIVLGGFGLAGLAGLAGVAWLWNRARQAAIVRLPNNHPLTMRQVQQQPLEFAAESLQAYYAAQLAEAARPYPQLTTLHQSNTTTPGAVAPALTDQAAAGLLPTDVWKAALDECPHLLVYGPSMAGKSTIVQAYITMIGACDYVVIDPQPNKPGESKWNGIDFVTIDPRRPDTEFAPIELALRQIETEDERRRRLMGQETFKPLVIVVDEGLMLVDELGWAYDTNGDVVKDSNGRKLARFSYFVRRMGRSARHRNIKIVLVGQGKNLVDLGLTSGTDRNNYALLRASRNAATNQRDAFIVTDGGEQPIDVQKVPTLAAVTDQQAHLWITMQDVLAAVGAGPQQISPPAVPPTQLPPTQPISQPTLDQEIVQLLAADGALTSREIAHRLGRDLDVIRTVIKRMTDTGTVQRTGKPGKYVYAIVNQSINTP